MTVSIPSHILIPLCIAFVLITIGTIVRIKMKNWDLAPLFFIMAFFLSLAAGVGISCHQEKKIKAQKQQILDAKASKLRNKHRAEREEAKKQRRAKERLVEKKRRVALNSTLNTINPDWNSIRNILKTQKLQMPAKMAAVESYMSSVEWMNNKMPKLTLNQLWLIMQHDYFCNYHRHDYCDEYKQKFEALFSQHLDITKTDPLYQFDKQQKELE